MSDTHIAIVHRLFTEWKAEDTLSAVIGTEEVAGNDYNLSPIRYVAEAAEDAALSVEEAVRLLRDAEAEQKVADEALWQALADLGIQSPCLDIS